MSLPTPSTSVSHRRFHQCVNHENKLDLRHPLPSFGSFGFFQASIWLGVDKVLQILTKFYKSDIYFNVASWFPGNVRLKPHFNTQCPHPRIFKPSYGPVSGMRNILHPLGNLEWRIFYTQYVISWLLVYTFGLFISMSKNQGPSVYKIQSKFQNATLCLVNRNGF